MIELEENQIWVLTDLPSVEVEIVALSWGSRSLASNSILVTYTRGLDNYTCTKEEFTNEFELKD